MQKACQLTGDTSIHIINIGIKDARFPIQRYHIIISNGSRNQCAIALFQPYFFTGAPHTYPAITLYTHRDDETVVFAKVTMERL